MPKISPATFNQLLLNWAKQHGRHDLPWQLKPTPYSVHVSEIMLQQTQVVTVIPYFERWMASFPTLKALAQASEDQIMSHWQGLGYYSRARNLVKAANYLLDEHSGNYPADLALLEKIPGVGRYTAGAIYSFAFDKPGPIVDGNVKRLFCRFFGIEGNPAGSAVIRTLWEYAHHYTPTTHCRAYAQALLDMGATICTAKKPDCSQCPLQQSCFAYQAQQVHQLPTPKPKKVLETRQRQFFWLHQKDQIWLEKRPSNGIWSSLWCLPEVPVNQVMEKPKQIGHFKHTFTHYKLDAEVIEGNQPFNNSAGKWFDTDKLAELGMPTPIRRFIERHLKL